MSAGASSIMTRAVRHGLWAILLLAIVGWGLPAGATAQQMGGFGGDMDASSADKVDVAVKPSADGALPGTTFEVALVLEVEDGWHVNAHEPLQDFYIGTDVDLERHPDILVAETRYPAPKREAFDFAGEELAVYDGMAPILLGLRVADGAEAGPQTLEGTLTVQACDNQVCLPPADVGVTVDVPVVEPDADVAAQNEDIFASFEAEREAASGAALSLTDAPTDETEIAALFDQHGWTWAFLAIFLIGLALNLTPCVYPMLSVTVSLFGGQQMAAGRAFGRATIYVLGIATMYSLLGVAAAYTGTLFGNWLQHPATLVAIGALLFALALAMFGLFELQVPASWQQRLGSLQQMPGLAGFYGSGLVVGIFAAPCIGPPIIALLAFVGSQADPLFGFSAFFVLALGLGLPYLILGTFSSLLDRLPQSGVWMVWVKKLFGVALVGVAAFYVGLAFFPGHVEWVLPATLLGGGLYLGFLERSGHDRLLFRRVKWAAGVLAIAGALWVGQSLTQPGLEWTDYSSDRLAEAEAANQPVMLDFYADWCIPCLELEQVTYTDEQVIAAGEEFERLKVDLTNFDSEEAEALRETYDVAGVPTIVFLGPDGEEVREARVVGFVGPDTFLDRMEQARDVSM